MTFSGEEETKKEAEKEVTSGLKAEDPEPKETENEQLTKGEKTLLESKSFWHIVIQVFIFSIIII